MTTPPNIAALAGSLTGAQRRALSDAFVVQGQARYRNGRLAVRAHGTVLWNLRMARLTNDYIGTPLLTDLGQQVAEYLKEQSHDGQG